MVDNKRLEYLESIYQDKCCITQNDKDIQSIIKELIEYRTIGSIEGYKAADEKQQVKKLIQQSTDEKTHYKCVCGKILMTVYNDGFRWGSVPKHCVNCGQRIEEK